MGSGIGRSIIGNSVFVLAAEGKGAEAEIPGGVVEFQTKSTQLAVLVLVAQWLSPVCVFLSTLSAGDASP
jgi:hypothetical protein